MQLHNISILVIISRYTDWIIREETELELHLNNMNRQDGFCLNRSQKDLINTLNN
jgi:hypothetical protein